MRFYLVEIEGTDLGLPDGTPGFIANRYVAASSTNAAAARALRLTQRVWKRTWAKIGSSEPRFGVEQIERISFWSWLKSRRQNRGRIFYAEYD